MPSTDNNPLAAALTDGAPQIDVAGSALPQRTLGENVTALCLIAPTLLNWAVLAHARWAGTAELADSEGVSYTIPRFRNWNCDNIFFVASVACISSVFAHIWLTAGAIARRHALDQAGAHGGVGYAARLAAAEAEARKLSAAEWAHVGLVAFDWFFAAFFVFKAAGGAAFIGTLPGLGVTLVAQFVLAPARAAVLRKQRTNSVAFVGGALRGSLAALMVQTVVLARCVFPMSPMTLPILLSRSPVTPAQVRGVRDELPGGPVGARLRIL